MLVKIIFWLLLISLITGIVNGSIELKSIDNSFAIIVHYDNFFGKIIDDITAFINSFDSVAEDNKKS